MARGGRAALALALLALAAACDDAHVVAQIAPSPGDCSFGDPIRIVHGRFDLALADRYRGLLEVDGRVSSPSVELRDSLGVPLSFGQPNPFRPPMSREGRHVELELVPPSYAAELGSVGFGFTIVAAVSFAKASWDWPLWVCHGCLAQCADAPSELGCLPGQDLPSLVQHGEPGFEDLCPAR